MRHPLLLGLLLSGASVAHAQADWQLEMRPSLWAAGMRGDVGFGRFSANHVEAMSFNAFRSPHADFMGMLEGRKRHTGFYLGAIYLPLKQDRLAPGGFPGDVQARPRPQACTVAATRRALHVPTMSDLSFGLLANDMKVDLAMAPSALARSGRSAFKRTGRVDGLVGGPSDAAARRAPERHRLRRHRRRWFRRDVADGGRRRVRHFGGAQREIRLSPRQGR